jgi:MFS family permease
VTSPQQARRDAEGRWGGLLAVSSLALAGVYLPVFALGAGGVTLMGQLGFTPVTLGVLVATARLTSAVAATPAGRLADRLADSRGAGAAVRAACALAVVSSVALALASTPLLLAAALVPVGVAQPLAQTAVNVALLRGVPQQRRGLAFAVKQSAMPAAVAMAGVSVPLLFVAVSWRAGFAVAALLPALGLLLSLRVRWPAPTGVSKGAAGRRLGGEVVTLAVAFAVAMAAAMSLGAFSVAGLVDAGTLESQAGWWLGVAGLASIVARLMLGVAVDRFALAPLAVAATALLVGAGGYVSLAFAERVWLPGGLLLAYMLAWGFNGVFSQGVTARFPERAGEASGAMLTASAFGGLIGPVVFGVVATESFAVAWLGCAALALLAGVLMLQVSWAGSQPARPGADPA